MAQISDIEWIIPPEIPGNIRHTYLWCHIGIDEDKLGMSTQSFISLLSENGIECRNRYIEPLYKQPIFTNNIPEILKFVAGDHLPNYGALHLPNVEKIAGRVIGLPNRPDLTDSEIDHIVRFLRSL